MADRPWRYVHETLRMSAGMLIWAAHLGVIYGVVGLGCARGWPAAPMLTTVAVATLVALAASGWVLAHAVVDLRSARDTRRFLSVITALTAAAALIAIAWDGLPILIVPAC